MTGEYLFRHESARILAALTRVLGVARLDLAEDAVQDALVAAMRHWPYRGVPDNPGAWLMRAARNRALDLLRREGTAPVAALNRAVALAMVAGPAARETGRGTGRAAGGGGDLSDAAGQTARRRVATIGGVKTARRPSHAPAERP
jgi:DNA-directed RNA polymerase specialized sigma24 family protein